MACTSPPFFLTIQYIANVFSVAIGQILMKERKGAYRVEFQYKDLSQLKKEQANQNHQITMWRCGDDNL